MTQEANCGEVAVVQVYWPGKPPLPSCPEHMTQALGVAGVMGFYLHFDNCDPTPCQHAASEAKADSSDVPAGYCLLCCAQNGEHDEVCPKAVVQRDIHGLCPGGPIAEDSTCAHCNMSWQTLQRLTRLVEHSTPDSTRNELPRCAHGVLYAYRCDQCVARGVLVVPSTPDSTTNHNHNHGGRDMMDSESAPTLKAIDMHDRTVRRIIDDVMAAEYRHGYYLREILRSEKGWTCIWERTPESYATDFDWAMSRADTGNAATGSGEEA